jgi:uncharacterized Zn-binding protein involved in type VI secretion
MEIIGWIRRGDKAACGGIVIEGDPFCISYGQPYAFQGARMGCQKNCLIAEGYLLSTLTNGRAQVIHGMITTPGSCPLLSTLNDIDGVGNGNSETIANEFFLNAAGEWTAVKELQSHEEQYDEQTNLETPPIEGVPYFIETMDGRTFSGRAGPDGLLPRIDTYGEDEYTAYWGDDALAKMKEGQGHG